MNSKTLEYNCEELARLSLFNPIYIGANNDSEISDSRRKLLSSKLITLIDGFIEEILQARGALKK